MPLLHGIALQLDRVPKSLVLKPIREARRGGPHLDIALRGWSGIDFSPIITVADSSGRGVVISPSTHILEIS